jgi:membrane fusion protein, multidrug efflux system
MSEAQPTVQGSMIWRPRRRAVAVMLALTLFALAMPRAVLAQAGAPAGGHAPLPAVVTMAVQRVPLNQSSEFIGHVQAIQSVDIHAQVSGILRQVAFMEGQDINKGALLYLIDPATFQAAEAATQAQLASAQASLTQAEDNLQRQQALYERQSTPQVTLVQAKAQRDIAKANVAAAQAQVQTAQINLGYARIASPIAGRVGATAVTAGNLVGPTTGTLTTVVQLDPIRVVFSANERALVAFKQSHPQASQDEINARFIPRLRLPDNSMFDQAGKVTFVDNRIDPATGTIAVYADFPNPRRLLLPGMLVTAIVKPETPVSGFLIPAGAVQQDSKGSYLLVVGPDNKIARRDVKTAGEIDQNTAIAAGLNDGDRVVIEGGQKVRPGQTVKPVAQSASPATHP